MRRIISLLCLLTVVSLVAPAGLAAGPGAAPQSKLQGNDIIFSNDVVRVWFQDEKPMLKVFPVVGDAAPAFSYSFDQVVEYRDLAGDGLPTDNEVVSRLDLHAASGWSVQRSTASDGAVVLNLTLSAPVKPAHGPDGVFDNLSLPAAADATVSLVFTLRGSDIKLSATNASLDVPASAVKYDFLVTQWPFVNAALDRLALDARVSGNATIAHGAGVESGDVKANGTSVGSLGWTTTARGVTSQGVNVTVPVRAASAAQQGWTRVVFTYDAPSLATLAHDPTIGLSSGLATAIVPAGSLLGAAKDKVTPGAGVFLVAGAFAAVALTFRRT